MAAHQYWRVRGLRSVNNGGFFYGLSGIEMAVTIGGPTVCVGGTPYADLPIQAGSAAAVFAYTPGVSIIQWNNSSPQHWVAYDFGAGNEKDIVAIKLWPNKDDTGRMWTDFIVEFSDDNATWFPAWIGYYNSWAVGVGHSFNMPTGSTFERWRVRGLLMQGGGSTMSCAELLMMDTPGGSNLATGGTASARSTFGGFPPSNAFDGNPATFWSGNGDINESSWLAYDFGAGNDYDIVQVSFQLRPDAFNQGPVTAYVECGSDGESWLLSWSFTATWTTNGQVQVFDAPPGITIQAAQFSAVQVGLADPVPTRIAQFAMIAVISGTRQVVSLRGPVSLPCWQPCTSFGFNGRIIYV